MSEAVERRIVAMLAPPLVCPHGNPIPGLDELGVVDQPSAADSGGLVSLSSAASATTSANDVPSVVIDRISEQIQPDASTMRLLTDAGVRPGRRVNVRHTDAGVEVWSDGAHTRIDRYVSDHVFVRTD